MQAIMLLQNTRLRVAQTSHGVLPNAIMVTQNRGLEKLAHIGLGRPVTLQQRRPVDLFVGSIGSLPGAKMRGQRALASFQLLAAGDGEQESVGSRRGRIWTLTMYEVAEL